MYDIYIYIYMLYIIMCMINDFIVYIKASWRVSQQALCAGEIPRQPDKSSSLRPTMVVKNPNP